MEIKITIERHRTSVTQGSADVLINGEKLITFHDEICLIKPGEKIFGEKIGSWASKTPDTNFIIGLLRHPLENTYHYSNLVKEALIKQEQLETINLNTEETQMNKKPSGIIDGKLHTIEITGYEPIPGDPIHVRETKPISYQEAFDQLKEHLEEVGMLPSDYFELSLHIADTSASIPENHSFIDNVSYGVSEGIYLNIYLNTSNGIKSFATGKTLDEDVESFLHMSRIAAECNLMLNGNGMVMDVPQDIQDFLEYQKKCNSLDESEDENSDEMSM